MITLGCWCGCQFMQDGCCFGCEDVVCGANCCCPVADVPPVLSVSSGWRYAVLAVSSVGLVHCWSQAWSQAVLAESSFDRKQCWTQAVLAAGSVGCKQFWL